MITHFPPPAPIPGPLSLLCDARDNKGWQIRALNPRDPVVAPVKVLRFHGFAQDLDRRFAPAKLIKVTAFPPPPCDRGTETPPLSDHEVQDWLKVCRAILAMDPRVWTPDRGATVEILFPVLLQPAGRPGTMKLNVLTQANYPMANHEMARKHQCLKAMTGTTNLLGDCTRAFFSRNVAWLAASGIVDLALRLAVRHGDLPLKARSAP